MMEFVEAYGAESRAVFRFEWKRYKRILQTQTRYRWAPKKMTTPEYHEVLYREDAKAAEDFSTICTRELPADPIETDAVSGKEALRDEWLVATLQKGVHHSVARDEKLIGPDGAVKTEERVTHF